ncbi:MAG: hypothetical protein ACFFG0_18540 [Candidatus Thorarchaeota archaeon]
MCNITRRTVYMCPICKKTYKNKGYYLNKHLKQCNAIAWIPSIYIEIIERQINEEKLAKAIDILIEGKFITQDATNWNIKKKQEIPKLNEKQNEMKKCVSDLKSIFQKGMNILETMSNDELMINAETKEKTDAELEILSQEANKRGYERFKKEIELLN